MTALGRVANRLLDLAFVPGSGAYWRRRLRGTVLCLLYHRVDTPGRFPFLESFGPPVTEPAELERDLVFWKNQRATFTNFRQLREGWWPEPDQIGILVCFDDGFHDNYTQGLEIPHRLGIPATIFQTASMLDRTALIWEHQLYFHLRDPGAEARFRRVLGEQLPEPEADRLGSTRALLEWARFVAPREPLRETLRRASQKEDSSGREIELAAELYPSADDLRAAETKGVEVASHGLRHEPRHLLTDAEFEADLAQAKATLAEVLREPPAAYSFPFGSRLEGDERITRRHYAQAAIVQSRPIRSSDDPQALPRCSWPGTARNALRRRRWLLTGGI
ncbi:MAG: polysaccharide deacetylase family protein [Thermoanaerobaculia bacterium]